MDVCKKALSVTIQAFWGNWCLEIGWNWLDATPKSHGKCWWIDRDVSSIRLFGRMTWMKPWEVNGKSSSRHVNRRRILRSASCGCSLLGKRRHYLPHQGHPAQQLSWTRSRPGRGKYALPGEQRATWSWQGGLQGWDSLGMLVLAQKRNGLVDDVY